MVDNNPIVWVPSEDDLKNSSIAKFRDYVNHKQRLSLKSYHDLHSWSVNPAMANDFWMALFKFLDISVTKAPTRALADPFGDMFPSPEFFPGSLMNFAENVFRGRDPSRTAIIEATEGSLETTSITWGELQTQVEKLADAMRASGVQKGDRVAAVIATTGLAISLCLATLSIGAIWSSISPDFGTKGILDRLLQIDAKLIFTDISVVYNGKNRDLADTISEWGKVASGGSSLKNVVLNTPHPAISSKILKAIDLSAFLSRGICRKLQFEQVPFSHPGFIFYSSGTTGAPKCILHSQGGVLLQVKKDYILQIGVLPSDILFQYTTTAWIMWAFVVTALSMGTTIVVYTGSPIYPDLKSLFRLLSKTRVSILGTSAKYLTELMDSGTKPRDEFDIRALRKVTSTGSVLPSDVAQWFYNHGFAKHVQLISGSGGTDCACSFVTGNALTPIHADEIPGKSLGMAVDVFDPLSAKSKSLEGSNEPGELVCTRPFPSQPLTFWGPKGQDKYRSAYYEMFGAGVWVQGDLIRINPETKGIQMLGRSDGVLNPGGVRFGSAEIYNIVRLFPDVEDSVCTGQRRPQDRDETVILFLKLKAGKKPTNDLRTQIQQKIGASLSKKHVPRYVFYVEDIPYSVVGKKLEILVKNIISGRTAESTVVANPESLNAYRKYFAIEEAAARDKYSRLSKL